MEESSYRPWGFYEVLCGNDILWVKLITVFPRQELSLQTHSNRFEHWIIWEGKALATIGDETIECVPPNHFYIPAQTPHRVGNPYSETLRFIEIAHGIMKEDDIVRLEDRYGR